MRRIGFLGSLLVFVACFQSSALGYEDDWSRHVDTYLLTPEADAPNNALSDYIRAYKLCDSVLTKEQSQVIDAAIQLGMPARYCAWPNDDGIESDTGILFQVIGKNRKAMQEVINGNAKAIVKYPTAMSSVHTPVWNNSRLIFLGKLFQLEAIQLRAQRKPDAAIESLGHGFVFASRVAVESSPMLHHLACISMRRSFAESLKGIALERTFQRDVYAHVKASLDAHLNDDEMIADAAELECETLRAALENPIELINQLDGANLEMVMRLQDANRDLDRVLRDADTLTAMLPPLARGALDPEADKKMAEIIKPLHPAVKMMAPNFVEARRRELWTLAQLRLTWLAAAAREKMKEGIATIESIEVLAGDSEVGLDPYTREPMRLRMNGFTPILHSVGPDLKDDGGLIEFDATKGNPSPGDIVVTVGR